MQSLSLPRHFLSLLIAIILVNIAFAVFGIARITGLEKEVFLLQHANDIKNAVFTAKTQDNAITNAVEKTSPSVVSIVITKEIPDYQVEYESPFDDDSFFKNFNFKVPLYKQKGSVKEEVGGGTGFIVSTDGLIVTNKHVVDDMRAGYTVVLSTGEHKPAKVIFKDNQQDIAVLKIDGEYTPVALGDSSNLKVGQSVIAIGNALGEYSNSASVGIISGLDRKIRASDGLGTAENLDNVIQTDAAINRGNSGGPLVDIEGKVIGINVATVMGSSNISFAIPIDEVKRILKNIFSI